MAITEPAQFTTEKMKKSYAPIVFVEVPGIAQYWASRFIDISADTDTPANWSDGSADYDDIFENVSGVSITVDRVGGFATIGNVALDLLNFGYDALLNGHPYPENEEATIYLIFDDGTKLVYSEKLTLFTGRIADLAIDTDRLSFSVAHAHQYLTDVLLQTILAAEYNDVQSTAINTVIPLYVGSDVYGGCFTAGDQESTPPGDWEFPRDRLMIPAKHLSTNGDTRTFLVAGHGMAALNNRQLWVYDNRYDRAYQVANDATFATTAVSNTITIDNTDGNGNTQVTITPNSGHGIGVFDYWFPTGTVATVAGKSDWTNKEWAANTSIGSYASAYIASGATSGDYQNAIEFADYLNSGTVTEQYLGFRCNGLDTDVGTDFLIGGKDVSGYTETTVQMDDVQLGTVNGDLTMEFSVRATPTTNSTAKIYTAFKRYTLGVDNNDEFGSRFTLFAAAEGLAYGIWINGSGRSAHADYGSNGAMIRNPVGVIEQIARDTFGFNSNNIDTESFDTASNQRSGTPVDFGEARQQRATDYLGKLARDVHCSLYFNNENKLAIRAYKAAATLNFVTATGATPANADIWSESPTSTGDHYDQHFISGRSIQLRQTDRDTFRNRITLHYGKNHTTETFQKINTATNATSIANYGTASLLTYENPHLFTDVAGNAFLSRELTIRSMRDYIVTIPSDLSAAHLELGDAINVRTTELYNILGTATTESAKWQVIGLKQRLLTNPGVIEIEAWHRSS